MDTKIKNQTAIINSILKVFAVNPFETLNYKQVASRLGTNDRASMQMILNNILQLAEDSILIEEMKGKYRLDARYINDQILPSNYIIGTVDMKQTSKAYVIPDNGTEDIFISPNNTNHALNKDKVKVYLFPRRKGRKQEGQITEIISRSQIA